ncbi:MAG: transcription-repair coupling factor [Oscillospiraceae bacterium]|nr:transcription-repair coupling factor [Oscillospiraceae bacterium]
MKTLLTILNRVPEFRELLADIDNGRCPLAVSGLSQIHRAHIAAAIQAEQNRPVAVVCADDTEANRMVADLTALSGQPVALLSGREFTFHNAASVSHQWEHRRLTVLHQLIRGECPLLVATVEGLVQRTMPPRVLQNSALILQAGCDYSLEEVLHRLTLDGYSRCDQVEGPGQFASRGGILDVYSPAMERPVRAEFFGDTIDSMGVFDLSTQRRLENIERVEILPAAETLAQLAPGGSLGLISDLEKLRRRAARRKNGEALQQTIGEDIRRLETLTSFPAADRYLDQIYPEFATALSYLPLDTVLCLSDSPRVQESYQNYLWRLTEDRKALVEAGILGADQGRWALEPEELADWLREFPTCYLDSFLTSRYPAPPRDTLSITAKQLPSFGLSLETAVSDLNHHTAGGASVVVLCGSEVRAKALEELLREHDVKIGLDFSLEQLPPGGASVIALGGLSAGFEYPAARAVVLTEGRTAPARRKRQTSQKKGPTNRQKLDSFTDLKPGDLVVHEDYGIGRFVEMTQRIVDGVRKDYLKIAYAGTDVLYVSATKLDQVSKYIGSGEDSGGPRLNKLGSSDWQRSKSKTKKAVQDLAKGLIELYAQRQRLKGYAFHPDDPWQQEFENAFEYQETEDQIRCVQEIKADMERPIPMDRLLCGDVGYGKTEVALRAVMKCVLEGKQAAILVPTTVLAQQHFQTASQRFATYPIRIAMVSRFRTAKEIKKTLAELEAGQVDIIIGTHRLLSKDVKFKDLGLLVIDEEQRFGVTHKERLKEIAHQVDCLTLSATPIPRTLNMALSGLRDMSTIEQPPQDRQPVLTYVMEHDWSILADAMRRELGRGGQVYYLHNRVENIERTAQEVQSLLGPEAQVGIAHGQMTEDELSDVMQRMAEGEIQVLVCTTIIETGIDISNVNTLIIEDADKMGLAQLHQIRGRVGRSSRRAFAYLTYQRDKVLSEIASKRLSAVREFAEFGSGFQIAMRDLELRGAGNLLGPEQSGFLISVGYDLYLKLLEEAVLEEKGETKTIPKSCTADLTVSANIPDWYVPSTEQRMDLYRRIARIRREEDGDDLIDELIDRYGEPPRSVNNLISVALLRAMATDCGVTDLTQRGGVVVMTLEGFSIQAILALDRDPALKNRLVFSEGSAPTLTLRLGKNEDVLRAVRYVLRAYRAALRAEAGQDVSGK